MKVKNLMEANTPAPTPAPVPAPAPTPDLTLQQWATDAKEAAAKAAASAAPAVSAPVTAPAPASTPAAASRVATLRDDAPAEVNPTLALILSWKRPYESKAEIEFMQWLHKYLDTLGAKYRIATGGNVICTVPRENGSTPSTLFSCHTDTVHHEAANPRQGIVYDPNFGHIFLDTKDPNAGSCLGADDGAGVWLMLQMIQAKVPGTYVFHRGEERGCKGSWALLQAERTWLEGFDVAVAFDRPNDYEVISHQGSQRTASDKFCDALAKALMAAGEGKLYYERSNRGVLTDTKTYRGVIAECTNIGVGYMHQHGKDEQLDYVHLLALRDAVIKLNWEALPVDRDPKAVEEYTGSGYGWRGSSGYGYQGSLMGDDDLGGHSYAGRKKSKKSKFPPLSAAPAPAPKPAPAKDPALHTEDEFRNIDVASVVAWMETDPEHAAKFLIEMAAEMAGLRATANFLKGTLQ